MTEPDLDLSLYDRDAIEHALYGAARARLLEAFLDELDSADVIWNWDLATGKLVAGNRTYALQVLGTYWAGDGTFLWAWDHPNRSQWTDATLQSAHALHALGDKTGYAVFAQRKILEKWVPHVELAWVSGELTGGHPAFFAHAGETVTVLQVIDAPVAMERFSNAFLPGILLDFSDDTILPGRASVRRFLERLGFAVSVEDEEGDILGTKDNSSIRIAFNGNRVVDVEAQDG